MRRATVSDDPFINKGLSVYLDIVRFTAAIAVLIAHLDQDGLYASWIPLSAFSHEAVIIFFVLSGLVISNSVATKISDWRGYLLARATRIYSVAVPAIALSFSFTSIVWLFDQAGLPPYLVSQLNVLNALGSAAFLNEIWSVQTVLPWNEPYWSLCYEVWYYLFFGLLSFMRKAALLPIMLCMSLAGPAIVALFPVWLLGAWLAKWPVSRVPDRLGSVLLFLLSVIGILGISISGIDLEVKNLLHSGIPGYWRLEFAQRFPTDYLIAVLVALNFIAVRGLAPSVAGAHGWVERCAVAAAGYTFSIYLYHRPITHVLGHFFPNGEQSRTHTLAALVVVLGCCVALGAVTERKKASVRSLLSRLPLGLGVDRSRQSRDRASGLGGQKE